MTATIVIPQSIAEELLIAARHPLETAGVMIVSVAEAAGGTRLLVRSMRWVSEDAYARREWNGLTVKSEGYVRALSEAEQLRAACIWVHTHPHDGAEPVQSRHDEFVDRQIADLFRLRTDTPYYGALIVSPDGADLTYTGYIQREGTDPVKIDRMWRVGSRWRLTADYMSPEPTPADAYDRNVRAFGPAIQIALGALRVGVVGCGGTGSIIVEQLVRLGVRNLTLIDPDMMSESNVTRVYGSSLNDVGRSKVSVLADHIKRIFPSVQCRPIESTVTFECTARQLVGCDVIFGCTDDNAGRLILSRLSSYLLIPVIDCGVVITCSSNGILSGIDARVTVLSPGEACLVCRNRIDLARAAAEMLSPDERVRRADEGYAPALGLTEPAVVAFTTLVGAAAVGELLERLIGYGPPERPSELVLRIHEREISVNRAEPRPGHYCDPNKGKVGLGITTPFLEQTWQA